jgi:hypothetical protein
MSRGFPSVTALLGLLAVAGYQHRDKIAEFFGGIAKSTPAGAGPRSISATVARRAADRKLVRLPR